MSNLDEFEGQPIPTGPGVETSEVEVEAAQLRKMLGGPRRRKSKALKKTDDSRAAFGTTWRLSGMR
jgi:hypothetical protein